MITFLFVYSEIVVMLHLSSCLDVSSGSARNSLRMATVVA